MAKTTTYKVQPANNGMGDWEVEAKVNAPSGLFVPQGESGTQIIVPTKKDAKQYARRKRGKDDKIKIYKKSGALQKTIG